MSDADQGWKPSGRIRPQSFVPPLPSPPVIVLNIALTRHARTMAQAFSTALDSAFSLDSDVTELSQSVDHKFVYLSSLESPCPSPLTTLPGDSK